MKLYLIISVIYGTINLTYLTLSGKVKEFKFIEAFIGILVGYILGPFNAVYLLKVIIETIIECFKERMVKES